MDTVLFVSATIGFSENLFLVMICAHAQLKTRLASPIPFPVHYCLFNKHVKTTQE